MLDVDLSIAHLEAPVNSSNNSFIFYENIKQPPSLCFNPSQLDYLIKFKEYHFSALSTANNRTMDFGIESVFDTINSIANNGVVHLGTYLLEPIPIKHFKEININDINIGLVAFSFGLNGKQSTQNYEKHIDVANLNRPYPEINLSRIEEAIFEAKKSGCDFIILSLHWGLEFEFFPTKYQVQIAHDLAESGADLILGHHPHVIQPVKNIRQREIFADVFLFVIR